MRIRAAVTYEYQLRAPDTYRGEFVAARSTTCCRRALEAASEKYPNAHWTSLVVLLERLDEVEEVEGESEEAAAADLPTE